MTTAPLTRAALGAGLNWLYNTVQPDTAIVEHCGARLPVAANRALRFLPVTNAGRPLVVLGVGVRRGSGTLIGPAELLDDAEVLDVVAELDAHRILTGGHRNHQLTATIPLARPAHESLLAAVARYAAGCPHHRTQVCEAPVSAHGQGCPWHANGHRMAIWPKNPGPEAITSALRPATSRAIA
jgi:hypothetical protein